MEYYKDVLKKYAVFSGRARRAEYWYFFLFNILIAILINLISGAIFKNNIIGGLYSLAVFIPGLAVGVRRLHDTGKSGWYLLLAYVPFALMIPIFLLTLVGSFNPSILSIAGIVMLAALGFCIWFLVLMVRKGDVGPNKYGPDPKELVASAAPAPTPTPMPAQASAPVEMPVEPAQPAEVKSE